MSQHETHPELAGLQTKALVVGVIGLAAAGAGYAMDSEQFFHSYLTGFLYWLAISLGCIGWTMIHHLTDGNWGFPVRRIWEAGSRTIILMALLALPILFVGMDALFPWVRPEAAHDTLIQGKAAYLNTPFFMGRSAAYFFLWIGFALYLSGASFKLDALGEHNEKIASRMRKVSGLGVFVMAITVTFFSVDYAMSIDPHWFSTIFGFLFAVSNLLSAMAFTIVMARMLRHRSPLDKALTTSVWHDLGNLLMAFTILWAYMSFSQFLIIWSGNTQEEVPWYIQRMGPGWLWISLALVIFHFALPLLVLLTRKTKRAPQMLVKVALYMLVMRFVDLFWITQPSLSHGGPPHPHWLDLAVMAGIGGLWLGVFGMQLKDKHLVPQTDYRLKGVLEGATEGHH